MDRLLLCSFNSTGLGRDKEEYIREVLTSLSPDFMLLQETWLLPSNLGKLACIHKDYVAHGVSSVDNSTLLLGRPYGGVGILWHKKWSKYVHNINVPESNRVCAVAVDIVCMSFYYGVLLPSM